MKRIFIAVLCMAIGCFAFTQPTFAHVLKTDGDLGAVLHIKPDDNPIAGVRTTYELSFSGEKQFTLQGCDCKVSYILHKEIVKTEPLNATSSVSTSNTFNFEKPGVYTFKITGTPKQTNSFAAFTLEYPVRIGTNNQLTTQPFPVSLGIAFGLMTLILLLVAMKADGMLDTDKMRGEK